MGINLYSCNTPQIINNIIMNSQAMGIAYENISGSIFRNNNVYNNNPNYSTSGFTDQTGINGNISQNSAFVDAVNGNFKLASNSPCINSGYNVGIAYAGTAPDMGAFEFNGTGTLSINTNVNANFTITRPDGSSSTVSTPWNQSNLPIGVYGIYPQNFTGYLSPKVNFISLMSGENRTYSDNYIIDNKGPVGKILVNGGEHFTQSRYVTIYNDIIDSINGINNGSVMQFSNNGTNWTSTETICNKKYGWDLNSNGGNLTEGQKIVYAKFTDSKGLWSDVIKDTILYKPNGKIVMVPRDTTSLFGAFKKVQEGDILFVDKGIFELKDEAIAVMKTGTKFQGAGANNTKVLKKAGILEMNDNCMISDISFSDNYNTGYPYTRSFNIIGFNDHTISNCIFNNSIDDIRLYSTSGKILIRNSIFANLRSGYGFLFSDGGGTQNKFIVSNCVFDAGNTISGYGEKGIRINSLRTSNHLLTNNIFTNFDAGDNTSGNTDQWGAGIFVSSNSSSIPGDILLKYNNFYNNKAEVLLWSGIALSNQINPYRINPSFVDNVNYKLPTNSMLRNAGSSELIYRNHDGFNNTVGVEGGPFYNTPPVANVTVSPLSGNTNTVFTFDASNSIDAQTPTQYLQVRWDFNDDGIFDTDFSKNLAVQHQFSSFSNDSIVCWIFDEHMSIGYKKIANPLKIVAPAAPKYPQPNHKQAEVAINNLKLSWNSPAFFTDSLKFYIYHSTDSLNITLKDSVYRDTTYTFTQNLQLNTNYFWKIVAKNTHNLTTASPVWKFKTQSFLPITVPTNLYATGFSSKIKLTWQDLSNNEKGFYIERKKIAETNYSQIAAVDSNVTMYNDEIGIVANTVYQYRIRAYNTKINSGYSNIAQAKTLYVPMEVISPDYNATAVNLTTSLKWKKYSGATNYYLQVANDSLFINLIATDSMITDTIFNISGLQNNAKYYWRVQARGMAKSMLKNGSFISNSADGKSIPNISEFTEKRSFLTKLKAVTLNTPVNNIVINDTIATFKWNNAKEFENYSELSKKDDKTIKYLLALAKDSSFTEQQQFETTALQFALNIKNYPRIFYYWKVKVIDPTNGNYSDFTAFRKFKLFNRSPLVIQTIADTTVLKNFAQISINLNKHFKDPDKDKLNYQINQNNCNEVVCAVSDSILDIFGVYDWTGESTVKITASDEGSKTTIGGGKNSASISFKVKAVPLAISLPLSYTFTSGDTLLVDFKPLLSPVNNLAITVSNNNNVIVKVLPDNKVVFKAKPNWFGIENHIFTVFDDYGWSKGNKDDGSVCDTVKIIVSVGSSIEDNLPQETKLYQNYPNPFNPQTTIHFDLAKEEHVLLEIYNYKGELVKTLNNANMPSGRFEFVWNSTNSYGTAVSSGVYFYRLKTDSYHKIMRAIMVK